MRRPLFALFAFCVSAWSPAVARPYDAVVESGTLRVAVYSDNAPFSDTKDGRPVGIDVELAEAIAAELKVKLDLRLVDAAEDVDGDFRLNLWRGDLAGSPLADLMLHVPHDKILATRNEQIFLTRPYTDQSLAFAWRKGVLEAFDSLRDLEGHSVAVEGTSASDALLMIAEGGRYRGTLRHFRSFDAAAKAYLAGETPVLAGTRAAIEAAFRVAAVPPDAHGIAQFAVPGLVKTTWDLGGAVRTDSRDLAYRVGDAIAALIEDGRLKAIFAKHGVTLVPPKGY